MSDDIENRDDINAIRRNIEATRHRISGEVEELSERLTPEHAKQVAKEKLVEAKDRMITRASDGARAMAHTTADASRRLGSTIRDNPIPTAMVAMGAGWLLWEAFRPTSGPTYDRMESAKANARGRLDHSRERARALGTEYRERARTAYSSAAESVRSSALSAKGQAGELYDRGRDGAQRAYVRTQDAYDTNPIAFGAVALLAGVGLGMILPRTERENQYLGERRQQLVDRARHMAEEAKEVAIESAKEGARAARERAREEAQRRPDLPNPR